MASENMTAGNITICQDLIDQLRLANEDARFEKAMIIW